MITTILIFLLVLVVLILVHEAGHAIIARLAGCRVDEFGIFFPPRIASKKIGETEFSLNVLPLGGFVKIAGEDGGEANDPRSFAVQPSWKKITILLAGVVMNFALAAVLFSIIVSVGIPASVTSGLPLEDTAVYVVGTEDTESLRTAEIQEGDILIEVEGETVTNSKEAVESIRSFSGTSLSLVVLRNEERHDLTISFDEPKPEGEPVGINIAELGIYRAPWYRAPVEGTIQATRVAVFTAQAFGNMIGNLFTRGEVPEDLMGPIGIASLVGIVGRQGVLPLMNLIAIISVNLALINILPIPALDGGRVLFVLLESVGIRRLHGNPERLAHTIGFIIVIGLILLITIQDISRIFNS